MAKYQYERQILFSQKKQTEIGQYLSRMQNFHYLQIRDHKNNSVLHHAAYMGHLYNIQKYIEKAFQLADQLSTNATTLTKNKSRIKSWVNAVNDESFTALHYAAYRGHLEIVDYLIDKGADFKQRTKRGMTLLHLAAQGKQVKMFLRFQNTLQINARDEKNSTPLHWAAYIGSDTVVDYILAQPNSELNVMDSDGQTPLHLACMYGNSHIVKKLLIAGANSKLRNKQSKTAQQIAKQNDFIQIMDMLRSNFTCCEHFKMYCNCKTELKPKKKNWVKPILFILYFFLNLGMGVIEYYTPWQIYQQISWFNYSIFICCLLAIMMTTFLLYLSLLVRKSPLHRLKPQTFIQYKNLETICFCCSAEKPPRSVHCSACGICIENYDHHCLWINGCVGRHNLPRFLWFLICFVAFLLTTGVNGGLVGYFMCHTNLQIGFNLNFITLIVSALQVLSFLTLVGPIVFLLFIQVKNVYLNKTTYERFSKLKRSRYHSQSYVIKHRLQRRQLQGSCSNILALLCCCCSKPEGRLSITTINDSLEEEFF